MKVHIINTGCKVNFAEASSIKQALIEDKYEFVDTNEDADIIIINTCSVTNQAESGSRQLIRRARQNNPSAFIAVIGCYASLASDEIIATTGANACFSQFQRPQLPQLLKQQKFENKESENELPFEIAYSADSETRKRAFLKLQDGCDYKCSFCIIPKARGASRSADFSNIEQTIYKLIDSNYKEIVICGINLSDYHYNNKRFIDLLHLFNNDNFSDIRFRISSIEPQIINDEIVGIFATSKNLCPHFHIPLQSGSDTILQNMKRRYNTTQFRQKIELISEKLPNAFIGLDIISGFPGETEILFNETYDFINSLRISALHCFTFSMRKGTPAATMPNQIIKTEKKKRTRKLMDLSEKKYFEFLSANLGKTLSFLPERFHDAYTTGHTENYIPIKIYSDRELENRFYSVKIEKIMDNECVGKIIK